MANQIGDERPTLAKLLKDSIEQRLCDVHVSIPSSIVSYDGKRASVQPLLQRRYQDGEIVTMPVISNVPVIWPSTKNSSVTLPLAKGDTGALLFSERSLDKWLVAGGIVNPEDTRKFHLSDAQFFPGLKPFSENSDYDPDRIVIRNQNGKIVVGNGKVALGNSSGDELLDLVDQGLEQLEDTNAGIQLLTVPTVMGPSGTPINSSTFAGIETAVGSIRSALQAIKDVLS